MPARAIWFRPTATAGGINCTAYATRDQDRLCVTLINKDTNQDAEVTISGVSAKHGEVMRLTGTALTAKDEVKLGKREAVNPQAVRVPAGSAALVWLGA